jgi:phosphoribosyl 1,2-cyclic phosphodiesterase
VSAAVAVAEAARVGQLALCHHSPDATDAEIDALADEAQGRTSIKVFGASENHPIEL